MNTIQEATKDCKRADCSITEGGGSTTLMAWTPTFDKFGKQVGPGDPNIHSSLLRCSTCHREWYVKTQYGKTKITELFKGQPD